MTETIPQKIKGLYDKTKDTYHPSLKQFRLRSQESTSKPYTSDFVYKIPSFKRRLRSANKKVSNVPKSAIIKRETKSTKKSHFNSNGVFKQYQRERMIGKILKLPAGSTVFLIDSVDGQVYSLLVKTFENITKNGKQLTDVKIYCVNGEDGYDCAESGKYNIFKYKSDLYDVIDTLNNGTKISLIWIDSMSGYFAEYKNFQSTKSLVKLMHDKNLLDNTELIWNANHSRHNISSPYDEDTARVAGDSARVEKHFDELVHDLMEYGYTTEATSIGEVPNLSIKYAESYEPVKHVIYVDNDGNSVYLYKYRDDGKTQHFILNECVISKLEKNTIVIKLTESD